MLLKQLLQQTSAAPNLLFRDPFTAIDSEKLVQEVIGLANIDFEGPRYLIFGVNKGAMEGSGIVGIAESAMADLKSAHRLISALVKPLVQLAFIFDKIDGKLVGALEIDGCEEAPFVVRRDYSKNLVGGQSWIRVGRQFRDATAEELDAIRSRNEVVDNWEIGIGFDEQASTDLLELDIPDTSNPPSKRLKKDIKATLDWKNAAKQTLETLNTSIFELMKTRDGNSREMRTLVDLRGKGGISASAVDNFYYFEEKAVKLNLTICNRGSETLEDLSVSLAFPLPDGFDVADSVHAPADDDGSYANAEGANYPEITRFENGAMTNVTLGTLAPNKPRQVFACPLRLAVGPAMKKNKLAITYTMQAKNKQTTNTGLLKIKFGQVSRAAH